MIKAAVLAAFILVVTDPSGRYQAPFMMFKTKEACEAAKPLAAYKLLKANIDTDKYKLFCTDKKLRKYR